MQIYKRIVLLGAVANPNTGDEAVLTANLQKIKKMYQNMWGGWTNCKIYILTKDASYTSMYSSEECEIIPVDYLHRFTKNCQYDIELMKQKADELLNYPELHTSSDIAYESLHKIFSETDILHIIGGGYINSIWPDMLYETLLATRLAKKYQKRYCLTGISIDPITPSYFNEIREILEGAEFADFRDDSYLKLDFIEKNLCEKTTDDAAFLQDYYTNAYEDDYATLTFHDWKSASDQIKRLLQEQMVPFIEECLDKNIVKQFLVLGFSKGDLELWKDLKFSNNKLNKFIKYKTCYDQSSVLAKHIVSNAKFNIGSRFHQAVFSLSTTVPILSIYYDGYYENKLRSIHTQFGSNEFYGIGDINSQVLFSFIERLADIKACLRDRLNIVQQLQLRKDEKICSVYGVNNNDRELLLNKLENKHECPKVSVIIPIYNMDAYLRECLDSVIKQSLKEIEIICVDDGSTDYTQTILIEYAWKDPRIKVITQTNHGVAYARNVAIEKAKGDYLFFLDPDDWLPDEDVLYDLYNSAITHRVLVCGGNFREHSNAGIIEKWEGNLSQYTFKEEGIMTYEAYQFDYGWVRFIYSRELILNNNLRIPPLTFFEDPVFFVQVMHKAQKFYCLTRCTYCYRTGHKAFSMPYSKVVDLVRGISKNIWFAKEQGYTHLLTLEVSRLEKDFAGSIVPYLLNGSAIELRQELDMLNKILYDGHDRIEYRMYDRIIKDKDYACYNLEQKMKEQKDEFYASTTWKVGNLILYFPKLIKRIIFGGKV